MIQQSATGGTIMKRVAIYLRVSTSKQDTNNQRRELETVAARSGWHVVKIDEDAGISGGKGPWQLGDHIRFGGGEAARDGVRDAERRRVEGGGPS
jgi:hypothetical protein